MQEDDPDGELLGGSVDVIELKVLGRSTVDASAAKLLDRGGSAAVVPGQVVGSTVERH